MDVGELFRGVAVIIDDEVESNEDSIKNILNQISNKNIPYITYDEIPPDEIVKNFRNLSFVLLDWNLNNIVLTEEEINAGVTAPATLTAHDVAENIRFIKKLSAVCFCPIFIFSNEDQDAITTSLQAKGLYKNPDVDHIFVKSKSEVKGRTKLFSLIAKWLKMNPSIYVLKEWEKEYQISKNKLFSDFNKLSPIWPKIMWNNFDSDGGNSSLELGDLISQNLQTRMAPFEFSDEILSKRLRKKIERDEIRGVIEGSMYISKENLHNNNISPGDVFKISGKYYVNIRPACDCIPERSTAASPIDTVELYLLKGRKLTDAETKKMFKKSYGQFLEIDNQSIIFPVNNGLSIDFRFKKLEIKPWQEVKSKRIGRILSPHIDRLQQRYASYLQRQGLPRTPQKTIF